MKKLSALIVCLLIGVGVVGLTGQAYAQTGGGGQTLWKLQGLLISPVQSNWFLSIPTLGGFGTSCLHVDNTGKVTATGIDCGSGSGGGGTDVNWRFFNGSGIRPATSTNQVLIGGLATSSLAQLEVHGGIKTDSATSSTASTSVQIISNSLTVGLLNGLMKATNGLVSTATAGSDYENPLTFSFPLSRSSNAISFLGIGTSSAPSIGNLAYWTGANTLGNAATTSVICSGSASCTAFTVLGSSPITITATDSTASSTLLSDNNTFSGNDVFTASTTHTKVVNMQNASTSLATILSLWLTPLGTPAGAFLAVDPNGKVIATTTPSSGAGTVTSVSGTFPIVSSGGTTPVISFSGIGTSSAPTVGNLAYWTGANTLGTVATTSASCAGTVSCTAFTILGSSPITITGSGGGAVGTLAVETPSGTINGSNTVFTTTNQPALVELNGGYQTASGVDYTLTGSGPYTITFVNAPPSGSVLVSLYGNAVSSLLTQNNWWLALQNFTTASTSQFTASSSVWFTSLANVPLHVDANGKLESAGSGTTGNCVKWLANNTFGDAGAVCGSGSGSVWPFTTTDTNFGVAVQSTTTPEWFKTPVSGIFSLMASSTAIFTNASTTNLTVFSNFFLNGEGFTDLTGTGLSNSSGALTVSGLTTTQFASANISQWTNNSGYSTWPFTTSDSNFGSTPQQSTTTPVWFKGNGTWGLFASSTSVFANASTTNLDASNNTWLARSSGTVTIGATSTSASILSINGVATFASSVSTFYSALRELIELIIPNSAGITLSNAGDVGIETTVASTSLSFNAAGTQYYLYPSLEPAFTFASSTLAYEGKYGTAGTTTISVANYLEPVTLYRYWCQTDVGTVWIDFGNGSATTTAQQCTTSGIDITPPSNNTWSMRQKFYIELGQQASNPGLISVTAEIIRRR
jgi:hypothetical protein